MGGVSLRFCVKPRNALGRPWLSHGPSRALVGAGPPDELGSHSFSSATSAFSFDSWPLKREPPGDRPDHHFYAQICRLNVLEGGGLHKNDGDLSPGGQGMMPAQQKHRGSFFPRRTPAQAPGAASGPHARSHTPSCTRDGRRQRARRLPRAQGRPRAPPQHLPRRSPPGYGLRRDTCV